MAGRRAIGEKRTSHRAGVAEEWPSGGRRAEHRRSPRRHLLQCWIALGAGLHLAAAQAEPVVQVAGVGDRAGEPPALHLLAGQATGLRLQLSSAAAGRVSFQADLFQIASGIAAPLQKELPVAEAVAFDGTSLQMRTFTVTPPEVKESSTMELRFAGKLENAEKWQPAGSVRFLVHPADLFERIKKQLATAIAEPVVKLVVVGESPLLKAALREFELPFDEAESVAETEAATLHLAEAAAEPARELLEHIPAAARLLLFTRDPALPAGVYWTERPGGFIGKVTLPVFTDFRRAPERQLLFANQFQQAIRTFTKTP